MACENVRGVNRDGTNGVKSIGIVISSSSNSPVVASEQGVIKKIGYMRGYGNYIVLVHNSRYMTVYANLDRINVTDGQKIPRGSVIGSLQPNDARLHFQINHAQTFRRAIYIANKKIIIRKKIPCKTGDQ
jgi:murein DD-endopeptidase MepM/ murein hydrolase activator NlpD